LFTGLAFVFLICPYVLGVPRGASGAPLIMPSL
jgi:hypothetical protein